MRNRVWWKTPVFAAFVAGLLVMYAGAAFAQGQCLQGDCENGWGLYKWDNGHKYVGEFRNGKTAIYGRYEFPTGAYFVGGQKDGKRHGLGKYVFKSGDSYYGYYDLDARTGPGEYTFKNGARYVGHYRDGKRDGAGKYVNENGGIEYRLYDNGNLVRTITQSEFERKGGDAIERRGCLEGNCVNGWGSYRYNKGQLFTGPWKDDKPNGKGMRWFPSGNMYSGEEYKGKRNGWGEFYYNSGRKYAGPWKDDDREGMAEYYYDDGTKFVGFFSKDDRNGFGRYYNDEGGRFEGVYRKDLSEGPGRIFRANGNVDYYTYKENKKTGNSNFDEFMKFMSAQTGALKYYGKTGCVEGDCNNGYGTYYWNTGRRFEGQFKGGKIHGSGFFSYPKHGFYYGEYKNGVRAGYGMFQYLDGARYEGEYAKDFRAGRGIEYLADGSKLIGKYSDGKRNGPMKYVRADGSVSYYEYANDKKVRDITASSYASQMGNWDGERNSVPARPQPKQDDRPKNRIVQNDAPKVDKSQPSVVLPDGDANGNAAFDEECPLGMELARRGIKTFSSDKKRGLSNLIQAQRTCPDVYFIEYNLGKAYNDYNRPDLALKIWSPLADKHGEKFELALGMGEAAFKLGKLDIAEKWARKAVQLDSSSPDAWKVLLNTMFKRGKYHDAYVVAVKNSALVPADLRAQAADYLVRKQWQVFRSGDRNKALTEMIRVDRQYPGERLFKEAKEKMFLALEDENADIPIHQPLPDQVGGDAVIFAASESEVLNIKGMEQTADPTPNAYALIVGISEYQNINGPQYARNDARQFQRLLAKAGGFVNSPGHIKLRLNKEATAGTLYSDIEWLIKKAKLNPDAKILFYFSGHGSPMMAEDDRTIKDGLLIPYDASLNLLNERTAIPLGYLKDKFADLKNENVIAVVDACFSGSGKSASNKKLVKPRVNKELLASPKLFITASAADKPADEYPDGRQGAFTYFFLKAMMGDGDANGDGWVDSVEAYEYARDKLTALGLEQSPQMSAPVRVNLAKVK